MWHAERIPAAKPCTIGENFGIAGAFNIGNVQDGEGGTEGALRRMLPGGNLPSVVFDATGAKPSMEVRRGSHLGPARLRRSRPTTNRDSDHSHPDTRSLRAGRV